jgi:histone H3/H4
LTSPDDADDYQLSQLKQVSPIYIIRCKLFSSQSALETAMASPLFPVDTIKDVADSLGIGTLSADAAKQLAMDVEYRIQEVVQEALKFMRHSKRTILSPSDISSALKTLNIEVRMWPFFIFYGISPLITSCQCSRSMDTIHPVPLNFEKQLCPMDYNYTTLMMKRLNLKK